MSKNVITLKLTAENTDAKSIVNAVRRAFAGVESVEGKGVTKGVEFIVKTPKVKPATEASLIRAWGAENGFQVGVRGVLSPKLIEAYQAAHKPVRKSRKAKASVSA
jgi:hypothetical protein